MPSHMISSPDMLVLENSHIKCFRSCKVKSIFEVMNKDAKLKNEFLEKLSPLATYYCLS